MWAQKDRRRLTKVSAGLTTAAAVASFPVAAMMIYLPNELIGFLFGASFSDAAPALTILAAAHLVSAVCGPSGTILNMTGFERWTLTSTLLAALFQLGLSMMMIPGWGLLGAAIAAGCSMALLKASLAGISWFKLQVDPTPLGLFRQARGQGTSH